ncbi:MAG TPA: hypothetical protein VGB53_12850 [Rubricoccaceae bacterium]|jgi:hypothetical protein
MTTRFLRAIGTLAVALVVLAGCDSVTDSVEAGGLATTANATISGPDALGFGCIGTYYIDEVATAWSESSPYFSIVSSNSSSVTIQAGGTNGSGMVSVSYVGGPNPPGAFKVIVSPTPDACEA